MGSWSNWLGELCLSIVGAAPEWAVVSAGALGILLVLISVASMARQPGPTHPRQRAQSVGGRGRAYRLVGNLLLMLGTVALLLASGAYLAGAAGSDSTLPAPVALGAARSQGVGGGGNSGAEALVQPSSAGSADDEEATATVLPTVDTATPTVTPVPTATPIPIKPGVPLRVVIPSIDVDSKVTEAGSYMDNGIETWETVPWVIAHYRTTAMAGAVGNAVFSGHVTSRAAGNVFADLYKVNIGDEVHIFTEDDELIYVVTDVEEVLPTNTSVMNATSDATATLITCAGTWVPEEHQYTRRLIVTAKLRR